MIRTTSLAMLLFAASALAIPSVQAEEPNFDERLRAQEAIERVYYAHQNGATRPFETAVPAELIRAKVERYLANSDALAERWHRPVTDAMLQRELQRMRDQTRFPGRLHELFAALDHDPERILECLVRPTLVNRLVRNLEAAQIRTRPDTARRPRDNPGRITARGTGRLPAQRDLTTFEQGGTRPSILGDDHRTDRRTVPPGEALLPEEGALVPPIHTDLARLIGDSGITTGGGDRSGVEFGYWDNRSLDDRPDPRSQHAAVWTGSVMLVWGGNSLSGGGWRYDPLTDTWDAISTLGAPPGRAAVTAVWAGQEMIAWGGSSATDQGGRYNPLTDSWVSTSTTDAPEPRYGHTAVWADGRMIVWGGWNASAHELDTGGIYDPATDTWSPLPTTGAPAPRINHTAVWTGEAMIVWGGTQGWGDEFNDGARYDPATNTWTPLAPVGTLSPRHGHSAVWTGDSMIVWGGLERSSYRNDGARYDPANDTWLPTSAAGAPPRRREHATVWTGSEMILWGGSSSSGALTTGARYDPARDTWTATPNAGAPPGRHYGHSGVWTGSEMIVWGGVNTNSPTGQVFDTGSRYDPQTDTWTPTGTGNGPSRRSAFSGTWTGTLFVVWGGFSGYPTVDTGARYDPVLDTWTPTSTVGAPLRRARHTAVWTGDELLVWGGIHTSNRYENTGGRYDPISDTWSPITTDDAPLGRMLHTAVWSGQEMLVWGGRGGFPSSSLLASGGRYDPVADRWTPMTLVEAPASRTDHTAVWSGEEMIVWGGAGIGTEPSGGRYDPSLDRWQPTTTVGAPAGRWHHTAVWVGGRMAIWGGSEFSSCCSGGSLYDPVTDTWTEISTVDAPPTRRNHSAVAADGRMIVWGGVSGAPPIYHASGGAYDPGTDIWIATSTVGAPTSRRDAVAAWTGESMIAWGGSNVELVSSGGMFFPVVNQPPVADAGPDQTAECQNEGTALVTLDGSASYDPDGDPITSLWTGNFPEGGGEIEGSYPEITLSLGVNPITLIVNDGQLQSQPDHVTVTVLDSTPPSLSVDLIPDVLWPPNHRMVNIEASIVASDVCDVPSVVLTSATSNEADNSAGDGNTINDIQGATIGTADFSFMLRAERAGGGNGRIYTVIYDTIDAAGNEATTTGFVVVPHDQGGVTDPIELAVVQQQNGTLVSWGAAAGAQSCDVIRGTIGNIAETETVIGLGTVTCVEDDSIDESTLGWEDPELPSPGQGFFYLVEYFDGTSSSYGTESAGKPRAPGPGDCD